MDSSWQNRKGDGYPGFKQEYGIHFGTVETNANWFSIRRITFR